MGDISDFQAAHYTPDDDDYQMLVAICYIKLNEYDNAKGILEVWLATSSTYSLSVVVHFYFNCFLGNIDQVSEQLQSPIQYFLLSEGAGGPAAGDRSPHQGIIQIFHE